MLRLYWFVELMSLKWREQSALTMVMTIVYILWWWWCWWWGSWCQHQWRGFDEWWCTGSHGDYNNCFFFCCSLPYEWLCPLFDVHFTIGHSSLSCMMFSAKNTLNKCWTEVLLKFCWQELLLHNCWHKHTWIWTQNFAANTTKLTADHYPEQSTQHT